MNCPFCNAEIMKERQRDEGTLFDCWTYVGLTGRVTQAGACRMRCDSKIIAKWNQLHQPGDITQEFADAVDVIDECKLMQVYKSGAWDLQTPWIVTAVVTTISEVLLILHAYGIDVDWPRKEAP